MFDRYLILNDSEKYTSSGHGEVEGQAQVVNLGEGLVRGNVIIDIYEIKISNNDELYRLQIMGGSDQSLTETVSLCQLELGAADAVEGNQDALISRNIMPFQNEQAGTIYPFVRIRHELSGTNPEINYFSMLGKDHIMLGNRKIYVPSMTATTTTTTTTT